MSWFLWNTLFWAGLHLEFSCCEIFLLLLYAKVCAILKIRTKQWVELLRLWEKYSTFINASSYEWASTRHQNEPIWTVFFTQKGLMKMLKTSNYSYLENLNLLLGCVCDQNRNELLLPNAASILVWYYDVHRVIHREENLFWWSS